MYQIPEIKLLKGSHKDTGKTGVGCFMNVIAYLNGEPQITDESECVCFIVRPIAIWLNDYCDDKQRQKLLPFILRAMGSRTDDKEELSRRVKLVVEFANKQKDLAAKSAKSAKSAAEYAKSAKSAAEYAEYAEYAAKSAEYAESAAEYAAKSAEYAAKSAAEYAEYAESAKSAAEYAESAAEYAESAAEYAESAAMKERISQAGFDFLDAALLQLSEVHETTIVRAQELKRLAEVN